MTKLEPNKGQALGDKSANTRGRKLSGKEYRSKFGLFLQEFDSQDLNTGQYVQGITNTPQVGLMLDEDLKEKVLRDFCAVHGLDGKFVPDALRVLRGEAKAVPSANALPWPTETYAYANREYGWNIVQFLEQRYSSLIEAGQVSMVKLRAHDPSAAIGIANYTRGKRELPAHLHIPTNKELNDRLLQDRDAVREAHRLARLVQRRKAASRNP